MGYGIEGLAKAATPEAKASAHRGAKLRAAMKRRSRRRAAEIFLRASALRAAQFLDPKR